jgi:16S rRNA (adenine1518-N6/adenine1519-N6)-dimethyltransferase
MPGYRPKKRLGQNFLVDDTISERIVKALDPKPGEQVVEIGPGRGALTGYLLQSGCRVTAIEFDRDLVPMLKAKFKNESNLNLIAADFLHIAADDLPDPLKIIGNLPYNISTVIIEKLHDFTAGLIDAVFTVQTEVAERLISSAGNRNYGSLTVIMNVEFNAAELFRIPPRAFKPSPKINSSVIRLTPLRREIADFENFKTFVRGCFKHKRKTLANSMESGLNLPKQQCEDMITGIGYDLKVRAEQLTVNDYLRLFASWRV